MHHGKEAFFDAMVVKTDNAAVSIKTRYYHQRLRRFYCNKIIHIKFNQGYFYVYGIAYIST